MVMKKEIGNFNGVSVMVNPETYEDIKKQKTIYENKILKELQQRIDKAIEYIEKRDFVEVEIDNEPFSNDFDFKENILNILRGEDNEQ